MITRHGVLVLVLALFSGAAAQPADPPASSAPTMGLRLSEAVPVVLGARVGDQPDRTRFVIEVSDLLNIRVFTLANPNRVVIDMPEVLWRLQAPERPAGTGTVRAYRYGLFRSGESRFVIDLNRPVAPAEPLVLPPDKGHGYRIVIDLFPVTEMKFEAAAGWPSDLRAKEMAAERLAAANAPQPLPATPSVKSQKSRVVVIDAGHGGIDSGTIGIDGLLEKNVVLDEALRLKKVLQKRGYTVHLTRESDIYIPLRERVEIARGYQADLFISLHADSNPDAGVSGASVYTLSESGSDREAAALARKENQSDIIAGVDLSGENSPVASILIDLAQRDTINKSVRFAEAVVGELGHATGILQKEPHRSAAFVVLKAPDVPAVLIELGYLSNAHDCTRLGTPEWREASAEAIAAAVDRNFSQTAALPLAAATPE